MCRSPRRQGSASTRLYSIIIRHRRFCQKQSSSTQTGRTIFPVSASFARRGRFHDACRGAALSARSRLFFARQATARPSCWARSRCACHRCRCRAIDRVEPRLRRQGACLDARAGAPRSQNLARHRRACGSANPLSSRFSDWPAHQCGEGSAMPRLAPGS